MDAMTILGKLYKQDGKTEAIAICTEGRQPASSLSLETHLACSGLRTCLFLPQNCHSCPQTQGKASLGALQPPLRSQAGFSIKRMTCSVGFSSIE